jgi:hypothetical protein
MADQNLMNEITQLRQQGLEDPVITDEMTKKGYQIEDIMDSLSNLDLAPPSPGPQAIPQPIPQVRFPQGGFPQMDPSPMPNSSQGEMSSRIEEIAESIIDEKWDELIKEVQKIIEWKDKIEEKFSELEHEQNKLKEDFKTLHQGVLGRLESYDNRMRDVSTELNAVGKVFKEVIPEFVENVKELSHFTKRK